MTASLSSATDSDYRPHTVHRVAVRLIPTMMLLYLIAFLDRANVGFAALTMNKDLGISDKLYGFGSGAFFLGYFFFEVPSNLLLDRFGARRWIARIMVSWGLVSAAMAFAVGPISYISLRILLGVAEAGFFPGMILYLTYWFPSSARARMTALFIAAIPISGIIGSPVSGLLLDKLHNFLGLRGWQWMFLLEGFPAVLIGCLVPWLLTDRPAQAAWLQPDQRQWLQHTIDSEHAIKPHMPFFQALFHPAILALAAVYFMMMMGLYGLTFWMPTILKALGLSTLQVGFIAIIPYALGVLSMWLWGKHSDASGDREWHVASAMITAGAGFTIVALTWNIAVAVLGFALVSIGVFCAMSTFWPIPSARLKGTAAAGGIALVNSVGNLGSFVGPYLIGWIKDSQKNPHKGFALGLATTAVCLTLGAAIVTITKYRTLMTEKQ